MATRNRLRTVSYPLRTLLARRRRELEMEEELRFHLEMEAERNLGRGMAHGAAGRAARIRFGSIEGVKEDCRQSWGVHLLDTLVQDVRTGFRSLARSRGFSAVVVLTLGLGIGANTAIFSVVRGILLRPLPYAHGDRLVVVRQGDPRLGLEDVGFSVPEIRDLTEQARSLDGVAEYHSMNFTLLGGDEPQRVRVGVVSASFFDLLGVPPLLGRTFRSADDDHGADAVLVLTHAYWTRVFGSDPGVVGRAFEMNDRPHVVVGVLPPLPQYPDENDVFMPASACPFRARAVASGNRRARLVTAFARLRPETTAEQARLDLDGVLGGLALEHAAAYAPGSRPVATLDPLADVMIRTARPTFLVLLATVGLVLLIACANVANLTLARLHDRGREMAVRAALGASRRRLLRQLLTENLLLALAGGAVGLLFAAATQEALVAFASRFTARAGEVRLDGTVLLFTLAVSVVTGLAFGTLPGLPSAQGLAGTAGSESRTTGGRNGQRTRAALAVSQLALSFTLLIGAALMVRSLAKLQAVDPGFRVDNVLTLGLHLNWSTNTTAERGVDVERVGAFHDAFLERVRGLPGVLSAGNAWTFPLNSTFRSDGTILVEGQDPAGVLPVAQQLGASPEYFYALGVPLLEGRLFTELDRGEASDAVVVNDRFVRRAFPEGRPLGKRISFNRGQAWRTVVGVVGGVRHAQLEQEPGPAVYLPFAQFPGFSSTLFVQTSADPLALAGSIRAVARELSADAAVGPVRTLEQIRGDALASPRLTTFLLGTFAGLALLIAVTGLSGILAYAVSQRTREIGVRVALGASPGDILSMVVRQGLTAVALGLAIGLTGALALSRLVSRLLFGVEPTDPLCFVGSVAVLGTAALIACLVPARQAAAIDPALALRA